MSRQFPRSVTHPDGASSSPFGTRSGAFTPSRWPLLTQVTRQHALVDHLWPDHAEDRRGAAERLAAFADDDPALLRRALLGEAGSGVGGA